MEQPPREPLSSWPVSWTIPPSTKNASGFTESAIPSDLYFSVLTIHLLTYLLTLQKKQLEQYIISCKTVADALRSTVLNTKTSSTSGGKAPWPQTPTIGSRSHARHGCVFDPHFSLPSAAPVYQYITIAARTTMEGQWDMYSTLVTVNPMSLKPETEIRNPGFCRSLTSYYRSHWQ